MKENMQLHDTAQYAIEAMRAQGFDHAQATASRTDLDELCMSHNEPSMLRSTASNKLSLLAIVDGRVASAEIPVFGRDAVRECVAALFNDAKSAPQDEANAVSSGQKARIVQGPQACDRDALANAVADILAFRVKETPKMVIEEGDASHRVHEWHTLTTGGSDISGRLGWYSAGALANGKDGDKSSSFNHTGGNVDNLAAQSVMSLFGFERMMRDTERQIHTKPVGGKFVGDVILTPQAVESLLMWFFGQLGDTQLIAGSSLYRDKVGQAIASPLLTIRSRFDMSGVAAVSSDAFVAPATTVLEGGQLRTLLPTLYGSRKTGLPHVPVASGGWDVMPGDTPLADMVASVKRGALVGRLSMGSPAANGNFSGLIKNSFLIEGGEVGPALSETMIAGNMAQMLQDIVAVSRERQDGAGECLPWLRIANLNFS